MKKINQISSEFRTGKALLNLIKGKTAVTTDNDMALLPQVREVWKWILGNDAVGDDERFFKAGGNSLKAVQLASKISRDFNIQLSFSDIFDHDTVRKMALLLESRAGSAVDSIKVMPEAIHYPVSSVQQRIWVACQVPGINIAYHVQDVYLLKGAINVEAFGEAFHRLINRHESLRTVFLYQNGEVRQQVETFTSAKYPLHFHDFSQEERAAKKAEALVFSSPHPAFDLEKGPLLNMTLVRTDEHLFVFAFTIHHIITDGWSMEIIFREALQHYTEIISGTDEVLEAPVIQYKDYVYWQRDFSKSAAFVKQRQYWLERMKGLSLPPDLSGRPRSAYGSNNGKRFFYTFPAPVYQELKQLCGTYEVTLFTVLCVAVKALLYRYTRHTDLVTGTPVAGRHHPELYNQIGCFLNILPLRTTVNGDMTLEALLKVLKLQLQADFSHQDYPFDALAKDLQLQRDPARNPLFDILLVLNTEPVLSPAILARAGNLKIEKKEAAACRCKYDMEIIFTEKSSLLELTIEYNTHLYTDEFVATMGRMLAVTIQAILKEPGTTINHLPLTDTPAVTVSRNHRIDFDF